MYIHTYMYNIVVNYFTIQKINCLFFVVKHCTVINENIVFLEKGNKSGRWCHNSVYFCTRKRTHDTTYLPQIS